jgi:PST family polysaccharide transporter
MGKPLGDDLRRKLLFAYDQGEGTLGELASRFLVSVGCAKKISAARNAIRNRPSIETSNLNQRAGSALKWSYLGVAVRSLSSLFVGVVLARLLGPKPFGLVAVASLVIGFGNLLSDFGFSAAIVQRDALSEEDIRFVFTVQMMSGVAFALACFFGAGVAANLFHSQEVIPVIRALSLTFPLQAFGQTASNLLRRKLAFRTLQIAQMASYLTFVVIGISLAAMGFGVWALVIAQLVQAALGSAVAYSLMPHSLLLIFRVKSSLMVFGFKVICNNVVNWSISNLDNAFVGHAFGVVPLGLYSRAFQLASVPMNAVVSGYQSVLLAACSRVQNRDDALRRVYLASMAGMAVAMIPLFSVAAVVSHTIIATLYGNAWIGAVPLLIPLALAMPLNALLGLGGPILYSKGKVERDLRAQFATAVIAVVVFAAACRVSVVCLAWCVLLVYVFRFLAVTRETIRTLNVSWIDIVLALRGSTVVGLLTATMVWSFDILMMQIGLPILFRLVLDIVVAAGVLFSCLVMAPGMVLGPSKGFLLAQFWLMLPESIVRFSRITRRARG